MPKINFVGDIALNNRYELMENNPFYKIEKYLVDCDLTVGNLECIAEGIYFNHKKFPRLKTSSSTLNRMLPYTHVKLVTLANNHCYDNMDEGFSNTILELNKLGISFIGASLDADLFNKPYVFEKDGVKLCFLNYVTICTHPNPPDNSKIKINQYDRIKIIEDIKKYRSNVDHIVLLLHWGGDNEGYMYPNLVQRRDARTFIDAGVSIIIGGHSHTLQPYEIYNGKYIFYSLGNFCFDDTICEAITTIRKSKEKKSIILNVDFSRDSYQIRIIPVWNYRLNPIYSNKVGIRLKFSNLVFRLISINRLTYNIYYLNSRYVAKVIRYLLHPSIVLKKMKN